MIDRLNVTITKTADGKADYIQLMSKDMISVNVVIVAEEISFEDWREKVKFKKHDAS